MLVALFANILLAGQHAFYTVVLALQVGFYLAAMAGFILDQLNHPVRLLSLPFYVCLLQAACIAGLVKALRGTRIATWQPVE